MCFNNELTGKRPRRIELLRFRQRDRDGFGSISVLKLPLALCFCVATNDRAALLCLPAIQQSAYEGPVLHVRSRIGLHWGRGR